MDANIKIELTPDMVIAIVRAQDRWPPSEPTPPGFFDVQARISEALDANPAAKEAVKLAEGDGR
ncbi:hypothetical protein [Bradyrhizobium guangdongense]|nr:hypothetical protein [Bradyrhizobium guangdongense]QOZ60505.1 hypothetical protein XH86_18595 [Bradyrhizobium guangdongense]